MYKNNTKYIYKSNVNIQKIRQISNTTSSGTTIYGMKKCLEYFGFICKAIRTKVPLCKLTLDINLPCIALVTSEKLINHYVVIKKIKSNRIIIIDPEKGTIKYSLAEFNSIFCNILLLIKPKDTYTPSFTKEYDFFYDTLIKNKRKFIFPIIISIILILFSFTSTIYLQYIINNYMIFSDSTLISPTILAIIAQFFYGGLSLIRLCLYIRLSKKINLNSFNKFSTHLLGLVYNDYTILSKGELFSRFIDIGKINSFYLNFLFFSFVDICLLVSGLIYFFIINKLFFTLTLITIIITFIISLKINPLFLELKHKETTQNEKVNSILIETINGIETVKTLNLEKKRHEKLITEYNSLLILNSKKYFLEAMEKHLDTILKLLTTIFLIFLGIILVKNKNIGLGDLMLFNTLNIFVVDTVLRIIDLNKLHQDVIIAKHRIHDFFDFQSNFIDHEQPHIKINEIQFNEISIVYDDKIILKNSSLNINKGQKIALVGLSGSGKTTLMKCLIKLNRITSGTILIDGENINSISEYILRDRIKYLPQNSYFFYGTVKENLNILHDINFEKKLVSLLNDYHLTDYFYNNFTSSNFIIKENGANLSSGQKQVLAFLRVISTNPDILIMDESFNALDKSLNKQLLTHLMNSEKTIILITHETLEKATFDKIYTIHDCGIKEEQIKF